MEDKFYTEILEENKEAVREKVRQTILDGIQEKFKWELPNAVNEAVNEFVKDEVVPEIKAQLLEDKDEIVNAATTIAKGIPVELGKALQERLAKNLAESWTIKKIAKELFD